MARGGKVYIAGTADTKGAELVFLREHLRAADVQAVIVDLSTTAHALPVDVAARDVAGHHPDGSPAVFTGDRGTAVAAMAIAFERFMIAHRGDVVAALGIGGSGGTALIAPAFRILPVGTPKLIVSTVASGQVAPYVGPTDIAMMYSVTDLAGLNRISREILANAAHAVAGMAKGREKPAADPVEGVDRPALGLTMFGVTTPCIRQITADLEDTFDCIVFHATGTGGQSMEKLVESGLLAAAVDITTTEVCDHLMGGIMPCVDDRFGAFARTGIPYVGSCGALDMVNFGAPETVPARYAGRQFYFHNPQVTLMRTTTEENARIGTWIGERLNRCEGEVRFLIPEKGVSALDVPGQPFHDPSADAALFAALEATVRRTPRRTIERLPFSVNDEGFARAAAASLREVMAKG